VPVLHGQRLRNSIPGVWISFSSHSPNCRIVFSLIKSENNWPKSIERISEKGKKLARVASGYRYSPILNSAHIWQVGKWLSAPLSIPTGVIVRKWKAPVWNHKLI
jgi:hypothetical protein